MESIINVEKKLNLKMLNFRSFYKNYFTIEHHTNLEISYISLYVKRLKEASKAIKAVLINQKTKSEMWDWAY